MATQRWMINRGENEFQVTTAVGVPTVSKNVELTVDLASGITKGDVVLALEKIKNDIITGQWPTVPLGTY